MGVLTRRQDSEGIIEVRVSGLLTRTSAASVRAVVAKCLAEAPPAVIIDLSRLRVSDKNLLTVFAAAALAQHAPAVPLLLAQPPPHMRRHLHGTIGRFVGVHDSMERARQAVLQGPAALHQRLTLAPTYDAPAHARRMVETVCQDWGLGPTVGIAKVVVTELVSNAVVHAATTVTVILRLSDTHLYLSVRDGSRQPPVLASGAVAASPEADGRGLYLVDVLCSAWGTTPVNAGKRVWAAIRILTA